MNWPLILTTGTFTLLMGLFVGFVVWVNRHDLFGSNTPSNNDSK
ncbi:hypothetical protein [[Haemophilus] ducreyi]|nr:hypothetical protein [[Haemophilus] ducreyi]